AGEPLAPAAQPFGLPDGTDAVLAAQGLTMAADISDGALPSGLSAMAAAAQLLFALTGDARYRQAAERALKLVGHRAGEHPLSFGASLTVMSQLQLPLRQLVVVTEHTERADSGGELCTLARTLHRAGGIGVVVSEGQAAAFAAAGFELFSGRSAVGGHTTAYLCEDFVCRLPLTDAVDVAHQLARIA
ncbi:MAG: thioredoxin domain-containing protein, partial [Rhodoglobus sp.]